MSQIKILSEKCIGCGICIDCCPVNAIFLEEDMARIKDSCNLCGCCLNECPEQAIVKTGPNTGAEDLDVSHLRQCKNIWVFCELRAGKIADCTFELLGEARRLAEGKNHNVAAVLVCKDRRKFPQELIAGGADLVYVLEDPLLEHFRDQPFTKIACKLIQEERPLAILFSATAMGRSLAPRIAARLKTGLSADCTSLELLDNGILIQTRPAFGGNLFASILCPSTWPQMATVRSKVMKPLEADTARTGSVIPKSYPLEDGEIQTKVLECILQMNEASVDEAEIVVSAGYGAANETGLKLVGELAEALGGAMGSSRKLVDAGFVNYERQIGQTGKTVGPKLYVSCGISGAVQHIVGISSSETIVSIDQDPHAPIFQVADIGIVADLYEFIPKLIASLKAQENLETKDEEPEKRCSVCIKKSF